MTDSEPRISITEEEYVDLLMAKCELRHLECSGVDNWQGYGEDYKGLVRRKKEYLHKKLPKLTAEEYISRLELDEVE